MRVFSSRSGTIRRSSPALALTRPMAACRIKAGCLHSSDRTAMGLIASLQFARNARPLLRRGVCRCFLAVSLCVTTIAPMVVFGQMVSTSTAPEDVASTGRVQSHIVRTRRFLGGRVLAGNVSAARAMDAARQQHAAMLSQRATSSQSTSLSTPWQAIGPNQVASVAYGSVTGRVTAIAIDPADGTGNTVYLGTTGGGVWKSSNATGPSASVTFTPLTDTLPVFSANAGTAAIPSLSIGAVSVQAGVILAGTGDPNDASDSFYGSGLLRSADGGLTWTLIRNSNDGTAGNHSFAGLGFAGFAWSGPTTVVAALSQAAEGALVDAVGSSSVM